VSGEGTLEKMNLLIVSHADGIKENRTKFVAAICLGKPIVKLDWLDECKDKGQFVSTKPFEIRDADVSFSITKSFENQKNSQKDGGVLTGRFVYVSAGVLGISGIPSKTPFGMLIRAAGATVSTLTSLRKRIKDEKRESKVIIVTNDVEGLPIDIKKYSNLSSGTIVMSGANLMDVLKLQSLEPYRFLKTSTKDGKSLKKPTEKLNLSTPLQRIVSEHEVAVAKLEKDHATATSKMELKHSSVISKMKLEHEKEINKLTEKEWEHEIVFSACLSKPVTRSLSNETVGDQDRGNLGSGDIFIRKSSKGDAVYYTFQLKRDWDLLLQARLPSDLEDVDKHMKINLNEMNCLTWYAYDTSGKVEGASLREFTIRFDDGPQMFAFLLYAFTGNYKLVNEFLTPGSRFYPVERTGPPHAVIRDINAMQVDGEVHDLAPQPPPLEDEEAAELYGEVDIMTQNF
jgi:hypothetical protein